MALAALWMVGRLAVAGFLGLGPVAVMALDCAFLLVIGAMITVEIVVGRNWSNLHVVLPVLLYLAANATFHVEAMQGGTAGYGRRLGFAMLVLLIGLIGGRIIPSFTRNWLAKNGAGQMPAPFGRFDGASLVLTLVALLLWVAFPEAQSAGLALILAGVIQALRLAAVVRVAVQAEPGLWVAVTLWTCGFAIFVVRLAPVLTLPRRARRAPTPQPR